MAIRTPKPIMCWLSLKLIIGYFGRYTRLNQLKWNLYKIYYYGPTFICNFVLKGHKCFTSTYDQCTK